MSTRSASYSFSSLSLLLSPSPLSPFLCLFILPLPCLLPASCTSHILGTQQYILLTMRAKLGSHNMNSTSTFRDPGTVQAFFLHMPGRYYGPQAVTVMVHYKPTPAQNADDDDDNVVSKAKPTRNRNGFFSYLLFLFLNLHFFFFYSFS